MGENHYCWQWWKNILRHWLEGTLQSAYFKVLLFDVHFYAAVLFSFKVGWAIGSGHIIKHMKTVHQNCVYHCATPAQVRFLFFRCCYRLHLLA